jgi:hypothetical protein
VTGRGPVIPSKCEGFQKDSPFSRNDTGVPCAFVSLREIPVSLRSIRATHYTLPGLRNLTREVLELKGDQPVAPTPPLRILPSLRPNFLPLNARSISLVPDDIDTL